jgi:hypothetical protein
MPGITLTCDYLNAAHTDNDDEVVPGKVVLNSVVWTTWRPPVGEWMVVCSLVNDGVVFLAWIDPLRRSCACHHGP